MASILFRNVIMFKQAVRLYFIPGGEVDDPMAQNERHPRAPSKLENPTEQLLKHQMSPPFLMRG